MNQSNEEHVLVIPTKVFHEAGLFQGFSPNTDHYLPRILDRETMQFMPRSKAEDDPGFKQIIPYVVFRHGEQVFHYQRGSKSGEQRLRALRSIGVGGHISQEDVQGGDDIYRTGMLREVAEEVHLDCEYQEQCIGLINDDRTPVGQVHLGVVHVFELEQPAIRRREEVITSIGFAAIDRLRGEKEMFESWSQILLDDAL